jgi:hypothetical protein
MTEMLQISASLPAKQIFVWRETERTVKRLKTAGMSAVHPLRLLWMQE